MPNQNPQQFPKCHKSRSLTLPTIQACGAISAFLRRQLSAAIGERSQPPAIRDQDHRLLESVNPHWPPLTWRTYRRPNLHHLRTPAAVALPRCIHSALENPPLELDTMV